MSFTPTTPGQQLASRKEELLRLTKEAKLLKTRCKFFVNRERHNARILTMNEAEVESQIAYYEKLLTLNQAA